LRSAHFAATKIAPLAASYRVPVQIGQRDAAGRTARQWR
jgi:hypothetical protein